jgi:hypothetical protein
MPTGYTSFIENGKVKDAKQFLHLCLRAFGVLAFMRDESLEVKDDYTDDIIKDYENDKRYHQKCLKQAEMDLAKARNLTDDDLYEMFIKEESHDADSQANQSQRNEIYDQIAGEIRDWDCDSELEGLKNFALEQIEISKYKPDTSGQIHTSKEEFLKEKRDEYRKRVIDNAQWDVDYHTKELKRVEQSYEDRVAYYTKVREELKKLD